MTQLTFKNPTDFVAQFVVKKGDLVVTRLLGIEPGAEAQVPNDDVYDVLAETLVAGNTYRSAPARVELSAGSATQFLAEVIEDSVEGTAEFRLVVGSGSTPGRLDFQKTTLSPVTFNLSKDTAPMQSVEVSDSSATVSLTMSDAYSIYAVVNGITTATVTTDNPSATITVVADNSDLESGYFTLIVS